MRSDPLTRATVLARQAPSLHNSQPWHWVHTGTTIELHLESRRVLRITDPDARLAVLSCGVALHHARLHLAATGWHTDVARMPDDDDPGLLARITLRGEMPADPDAARLERQAHRRHTDRRHPPGPPLDLHRVHTIQRAVLAQGAGLTVLRPPQVFALADAAEKAQEVEAADPGWQVEVAGWLGGDRPEGTGIPTSALPDDPLLLTAPARALRRAGAALVTQTHHRAATFTVLHSTRDDRAGWLVAGEGLSAGWLTATALDVAVLPLSIVTEVAGSRDTVRRLLDWNGYPHLVLRLAAGVSGDVAPTPRLRPADIISFA
jgi:hypothetical protein